jgi:iron complex transport system substrate-binding protein
MYTIRYKSIAVAALFLLVLPIFFSGVAGAREITDMTGRKVTVPNSIRKVYAPSPYGSYIMYAVDPNLLAGLIFPLTEKDKMYLSKSVNSLPVIGGLFGQGQTANIEVLLRAKPDLLLMWGGKNSPVNEKAVETLKKINVPYAYAAVDSLQDYPDVFLFLGKLLKREQRTKRLANYCRKTLAETSATLNRIPLEKRPTVYYAEGPDGLKTECNDSIHVELLRLAGDRNVHLCHTSSHMGLEKVSLEQLILYKPDVIIAQEKVFYDKVFKDPAWRQVKAVRDGRVYLVPRTPFNWFDRPPSFMRFIGLKWLMHCLYPQEYRIDIVKEARGFYRLFLGVEVSAQEMRKIMGR